MNRIYLAFGVHNHQPVGNFDTVIEDIYQKCYLPYLELLLKYPSFRSSMHFSGVLLEWMLSHHPQVGDLLAELIDRRQVELLTGGYYEPILPVIPDRDKIGQIKKYTHFLRQRFGVDPQGLWLAERVWEPHLAATLARAGINYTVLDDTHFKYSGLSDEQLYGYYVTEEQGETLNLMPIAKQLRYLIPFAPPEETIEFLRKIAAKHASAVVVYADDGEKFGSWPETRELVWEQGWLAQFVEEVTRQSDWLTVIPLGEVMRRVPPLGRVYLPTASYAEMSEWALPAGAGRDFEDFLAGLRSSGEERRGGIFARGGFWRNFMVKYPEANQMLQRGHAISDKIERWSQKTTADDQALAAGRDFLWRAQCNCAYWHGVFGGLYLPHLRAAVWENLIAAERLANTALAEKATFATARKYDLDADGRDEVLLTNDKFFLCLKPDAGGSVVEYDVYDQGINLLDGLTRREETYHRKLADAIYKPAGEKLNDNTVSIHQRVTAKEENLQRFLHYDWYRRASFLDHFFGDDADCANFSRCDFPEQGDFVNQAYAAEIEKTAMARVVLRRRGGVWMGAERAPVEVEKIFGAEPGNPLLRVSYRVTNCWDQPLKIRFGIEFCAALQSDRRPQTAMRFDDHSEDVSLADTSVRGAHQRWAITDTRRDLEIAVETDRPAEWWYFPLYTVSLSEDGFERAYQSSVICAVWSLDLSPGGTWTTLIGHYAGPQRVQKPSLLNLPPEDSPSDSDPRSSSKTGPMYRFN